MLPAGPAPKRTPQQREVGEGWQPLLADAERCSEAANQFQIATTGVEPLTVDRLVLPRAADHGELSRPQR
jgi:hypothetical protein